MVTVPAVVPPMTVPKSRLPLMTNDTDRMTVVLALPGAVPAYAGAVTANVAASDRANKAAWALNFKGNIMMS